jgi:UDP-glucuronate decarboxylase
MKKILVTGGAGFIGSHLCRRLLQDGEKVICLDNLFTGSKKNIQNLLKHKNFSFIKHDITSPGKIPCNLAGVKYIYNLACPASPLSYQANPIKTIKTNVVGMANILGVADHLKARILQASTSEVYGDPKIHPQVEAYWGNVNPIGLRSCYDEGKRCAETLCMDYHRQYGLDIRIVRIFNTYGPFMSLNDGRVVSNFIVAALRNKPLLIYGNGAQSRSFQYIDDLINGLILMMNNKKKFIGPVNIGNPNEFTIKELALKVLSFLPESKSSLTYRELPADDPRQRQPEISLAKSMLHWSPKIQLAEGLKKTIEYFKTIV